MDQEALFLLPRLDFSRHPLWHRAAPCPPLRLIFRIPVLRGYLSAFQLAAAPFGTPYRLLSRTYPTTIAKGGKLLLQLAGFIAQDFPNIVAHLYQSLD